jgi:hypothetical protein
MITKWTLVTLSTNEKFPVITRVGESDVFKPVNVVHKPKFIAGFFLMVCGKGFMSFGALLKGWQGHLLKKELSYSCLNNDTTTLRTSDIILVSVIKYNGLKVEWISFQRSAFQMNILWYISAIMVPQTVQW